MEFISTLVLAFIGVCTILAAFPFLAIPIVITLGIVTGLGLLLLAAAALGMTIEKILVRKETSRLFKDVKDLKELESVALKDFKDYIFKNAPILEDKKDDKDDKDLYYTDPALHISIRFGLFSGKGIFYESDLIFAEHLERTIKKLTNDINKEQISLVEAAKKGEAFTFHLKLKNQGAVSFDEISDILFIILERNKEAKNLSDFQLFDQWILNSVQSVFDEKNNIIIKEEADTKNKKTFHWTANSRYKAAVKNQIQDVIKNFNKNKADASESNIDVKNSLHIIWMLYLQSSKATEKEVYYNKKTKEEPIFPEKSSPTELLSFKTKPNELKFLLDCGYRPFFKKDGRSDFEKLIREDEVDVFLVEKILEQYKIGKLTEQDEKELENCLQYIFNLPYEKFFKDGEKCSLSLIEQCFQFLSKEKQETLAKRLLEDTNLLYVDEEKDNQITSWRNDKVLSVSRWLSNPKEGYNKVLSEFKEIRFLKSETMQESIRMNKQPMNKNEQTANERKGLIKK